MSQQNDRVRIVTPECVLSFPHIFEPKVVPGSDDATPKYSVSLVFPEGTDLKAMKEAALQVATAAFGETAADKIRSGKIRWPFRGINEPGTDDAEDMAAKGYDRYGEGTVFVNTSAKLKPGVVSLIPDPQTDKPAAIVNASGDLRFADGTVSAGVRAVYAGVFARVSLTCYAYDVRGNKGVTFGLNNLQVVKDGERLDGRSDAADEFEADPNAVADLSDLTGDGDSGQEADEAPAEDSLADLMG